MSSLKTVREEIKRTEAIEDVMGALEKLAGVERLATQRIFETMRAYEENLERFFSDILAVELQPIPPKKNASPLFLCFGPSHGLTGSFAERIADFLFRETALQKPSKILLVGRRLHRAVEDLARVSPLPEGITRETIDPRVPTMRDPRMLLARIAAEVIGAFDRGDISEVIVIAASYRGFREYELSAMPVFCFRPVLTRPRGTEAQEYVFLEPSRERIFAQYRKMLFAARVARPYVETKLVEASLRLMETNRAKENAKEIAGILRRGYRRVLRGRITRSINELFTGKEAFERRKRGGKVYFEWKV